MLRYRRVALPTQAGEGSELAQRTLANAAELMAWMEGWSIPVDQAIDKGLPVNHH